MNIPIGLAIPINSKRPSSILNGNPKINNPIRTETDSTSPLIIELVIIMLLLILELL